MSDYFFYDLNKKMADLANKQQLAEDAQAAPAKPNKLMEAAADYSAKKAAAGKDIGKPGKNFSKIAAGAAKRYGSAEAGKRVAGAVLNKLRHPTKEGVEPPKHYGPPGQIPSVETAKFDRYMQQRWAEHEATRPQPIKPPGLPTKEGVNQSQLKPYKATMKEGGKPDFLDLDKDGNRKEPMRSAARSAKKGLREVDATPQDTGSYEDEVKAANTPQRKASAPVPPPKKTVPPKPKMYPPQAIDEPVREADDSQDPAGLASQAAYELSYKLRNPKFDAALKKIEDKYRNDSMIVRMNSQGGKHDPTKIAGILQDLALQYKKDLEVLVNYYQKYGGPTPAVQEGGVPMTPKQKKFAALAKPFDKITFADKIVGAKKEVDEMLGDVAATAMKKAVRGRNRDMEEGFLDDEPTSRRSSSGGRIDTSTPGVTRHRAVKGNYSGAGHDASADDEPSGAVGRRKVGAGMGKKIGAKINRGTSKLMTKEGDMPEDMIEPQDSGEYDREGEMAKDDIKTVVRHAQALEKILGDEDNLPDWVQSKLAKIEGMMTAVDDYMQNQQGDDMGDEMDEESTNKRDNRAERAGRKVAKDIEYDEKKKDGIHGKRRGSEDDKAERAGRKVTKDIEWDEKHKKNESSAQHFDKGYYDSMDAAKKDNPKSIVKARKQPFEEESTNTRDDRAEKAGRKVAKDIEYDEKKKDGIHGKRRDSEDSKAERAGRKVTKDIEYDEKKDKKKKEVDETTTSGSVATGGSAPKSGGGVSYGKGIYDSLNRQLENIISESMNINMSMNNDEHGGPRQSLTVTATDEDAVMLAGLLKMAGMGHGDEHIYAMTGDDSDMHAIHDMDHMHGDDEPCADCGSSPCGCDDEMMDEAYGDTDATENDPDWPTDEEGTDNAMMYSGGLNGPKSTGQTTIPVIAGQKDRMGYNGLDEELGRMLKIAGIAGH